MPKIVQMGHRYLRQTLVADFAKYPARPLAKFLCGVPRERAVQLVSFGQKANILVGIPPYKPSFLRLPPPNMPRLKILPDKPLHLDVRVSAHFPQKLKQ